MKNIAVIPARSGSKRLKNKNIKKLLDLELFLWTIRAANASKDIDRIIFSTDSKKYVEISKKENGKLSLIVIDEGIGFSEKNTDKIFNRFYSNRPEKFGEHSGLGLNIVKNLVELHNGEIIATNNINKGAKVEIILPAI